MNSRAETIRRWVDQYRKWGWQPLPSDPTPGGRKKPLVRYADHWEKRFDRDPFAKFPEANIQLMTGAFWNLMVIDIDGPMGREAWEALRKGREARTWTVESGSGGMHLWFRPPADMRRLDTVRLWGVWDSEKGGWEKGKSIERLADRKLVMAPPSIHPETRNTYLFERGRSYKEISAPAIAPHWVLNLPVAPEGTTQHSTDGLVPGTSNRESHFHRRQGDAILDAIRDKAGLARSWGLRIISDHPNVAGWCECHVFYREDRHPSAMFSPSTGRYWDPETGRRGINLFELGVRLGAYPTYGDAVRGLAAEYSVN